MSVQRATVAILSTSQLGAVSRVRLVSQAVTGPAGADGSNGAAFDSSDGNAVLAMRWFS